MPSEPAENPAAVLTTTALSTGRRARPRRRTANVGTLDCSSRATSRPWRAGSPSTAPATTSTAARSRAPPIGPKGSTFAVTFNTSSTAQQFFYGVYEGSGLDSHHAELQADRRPRRVVLPRRGEHVGAVDRLDSGLPRRLRPRTRHHLRRMVRDRRSHRRDPARPGLDDGEQREGRPQRPPRGIVLRRGARTTRAPRSPRGTARSKTSGSPTATSGTPSSRRSSAAPRSPSVTDYGPHRAQWRHPHPLRVRLRPRLIVLAAPLDAADLGSAKPYL